MHINEFNIYIIYFACNIIIKFIFFLDKPSII